MIIKKGYFCPVCKTISLHETNHCGEIYCGCKSCGNSPLYCSETDMFKNLPFIEAKFKYYYLNMERDGDREEMEKIRENLRKVNFQKWTFTPLLPNQMRVYARYHDTMVKLYNPMQFANQYVSNIGRLFQWKEAIYPNSVIKNGYYLEF